MVLKLLEQGRPGEGRHLDCLRAAPRHGGFGGCDLYRFHHRVAAQAGAQALKGCARRITCCTDERGSLDPGEPVPPGGPFLSRSLFVRLRAFYCVWRPTYEGTAEADRAEVFLGILGYEAPVQAPARHTALCCERA